jgi:hypothetical protein
VSRHIGILAALALTAITAAAGVWMRELDDELERQAAQGR